MEKKTSYFEMKEKALPVIFYHFWLRRTFYEIRRHKPCVEFVEFSFLEKSLKRRFVEWQKSRILKGFYDDGEEHECLKYRYNTGNGIYVIMSLTKRWKVWLLKHL